MKTLSIEKAHNLSKLSDELLAAIPGLAPSVVSGEKFAAFALTGDGARLAIEYPDAVLQSEIEAVVNAHSSTPKAPHADDVLSAALKSKIAQGQALSDAELSQALRYLFRRVGVFFD